MTATSNEQIRPALHFVGFTDSKQYWIACQLWGKPDFIHRHWDMKCVWGGEIHPSDTIVFAKDDWRHPKLRPFSFDDSAVFAREPNDE